MSGSEFHGAGLFLSANPDGAGAADQRERIVADDFGGAFHLQLDGIVGERPDGAEFVGNAQNDAGRVGSVGDELGVVGMQREFLVNAAAGKRFGNDLLALQVAVDAQVTPVADGTPQINHKR